MFSLWSNSSLLLMKSICDDFKCFVVAIFSGKEKKIESSIKHKWINAAVRLFDSN